MPNGFQRTPEELARIKLKQKIAEDVSKKKVKILSDVEKLVTEADLYFALEEAENERDVISSTYLNPRHEDTCGEKKKVTCPEAMLKRELSNIKITAINDKLRKLELAERKRRP